MAVLEVLERLAQCSVSLLLQASVELKTGAQLFKQMTGIRDGDSQGRSRSSRAHEGDRQADKTASRSSPASARARRRLAHHGAVMLRVASSIGRAPAHPTAALAPCPRWSRLGPPSTVYGPRSIAAISHRGRRSRSRHVDVQARSFTAGRETDDGSSSSSSSLQRHQRTYDVVSLGNLCVDIVLPVASLPPPDHGQSTFRMSDSIDVQTFASCMQQTHMST